MFQLYNAEKPVVQWPIDRSLASRFFSPGKLAVMLLMLAGLVGLGWQVGWFSSGGTRAHPSFVLYTVQSKDIPINVIERGNLESQTNLQIMCEVDDVRNDGVYGTPIVWIIPNGSSVKKGELLVEFDSTAIMSELDQQVLDTERARAELIQAQASRENQEIENKTAEEKARLDVALSELELKMYEDEKSGTYKLAVEAVNRLIDDVNNEILTAEMNLKLRRNEKVGIESLFKLGYAGKSEKDRSVLSYLQAESDYAAKLNKMRTQMAALEKIENYEKKMQTMLLEGKLSTAKQNLQQVLVTNGAKLQQSEGLMASRTEAFKKEEELMSRFRMHLERCKIYAPQDGMVAYESSREVEIREGSAIRQRQHLMSLPNLKQMQVRVNVHESVLDRIKVGQKASITIDAFAERKYTGSVRSVAVLPEQNSYFGSDTKVYNTVITIDEEVAQLKPGMTAVAEVHVDYLEGVNAVPVQAIVQRDGRNWLYVQDGSSVEQRDITLGPSNELFVSVTEGVEVGESIVLNPSELLDASSSNPEPSTSNPAASESKPSAPKGTMTASIVSGPIN